MHVDELGSGPPLLLVHGVGVGPHGMAALAAALSPRHRVLVVHRRGYGASRAMDPADGLGCHVRDLVAALDARDLGPVAAMGVSGGATLVTALALLHPDRVRWALAHEPALGPLAPGVHRLLGDLAREISGDAPRIASVRIAATLAGARTWGRIGRDLHRELAADAEATCRDLPYFRDFAPGWDDLRGLRALRLVTSVGAHSPAARRDAAAVLADLAGAEVVTIPGAGHLAQLDNPAALALATRRPDDNEEKRCSDRWTPTPTCGPSTGPSTQRARR